MADADARPTANAVRVYSWHEPLWQTLTADLARLPHALLLTGPAGLGKHDFALRLAATLLCAAPGPEATACGRCHGCRLFAAGTHPDLMLITPAEDRRGIVIDQVRELGGFLALRPHTAARKIAILSPADSMNLHAANSVLKVLEEPPLGSVLMLVASQPERLPATVRSRCRPVRFGMPDRQQALAWVGKEAGAQAERLLDLAHGAPLKALALAGSGFLALREELVRDLDQLLAGGEPVSCAQRWKGHGAELCLDWLAGFVADLIRGTLGGEAVRERANPEVKAFLHKHKNLLDLNKLFGYLDAIYYAKNSLAAGALDELLLLEDLLIRWCYMSDRVRPNNNREAS